MGFSANMKSVITSKEVIYSVNNYAHGKYLRQFDPGDNLSDVARTRVPGTKGSYVMRNGVVGHRINMAVRYIAEDIDELETVIKTDLNFFSEEAITIEHNGRTYLGCNVIAGSARRTGPVKNTGRGGVYVDLALKFTEDLPA